MWCVIVVQQLSSGKFQLIDESFVLLFHTHFISLDPSHITFPLVTTVITEPRLALRWISSVNYSICILFLRV